VYDVDPSSNSLYAGPKSSVYSMGYDLLVSKVTLK
jgi:hypothetical protein